MKCPNCNVNLVMTDRSGIEIDYCPECRGVWLDRGELDKIIERSVQPQRQSYSDEHYSKPQHRHHDEYHHKKRKGLLGDLFDF